MLLNKNAKYILLELVQHLTVRHLNIHKDLKLLKYHSGIQVPGIGTQEGVIILESNLLK